MLKDLKLVGPVALTVILVAALARCGDALALGGAAPGPLVDETEPEAAFKDIPVGDNTLYPCTPGWDYVTGRGAPDIEVLVDDA